ncbi:MAG TPA: CYTH domain-containing protein [Candidatus Saccharimonadales bacterium]|nr:CYTH domain-containing protein [Candidatus Saccharimonadales bacterium]
MQTELEAKFLNVDHDTVRATLRAMGAVCEQPMRTMTRKGFDFPDSRLRHDRNGWVRVRDEGDKVTMSYKQLDDRTLEGTKEVCLTVDSFEQAEAFLHALGLQHNNYMTTKRESWRLGHVEIELDEWPWTKPYVEIEAATEAELQDVAAQLGLDWSKVLHGSVEVVYMAEYDITEDEFNSWPEITFTPVPEWLAAKRKADA